MRINDLLMMSIRSLWRRKLRTFLTILGVVIGATSIILMLSLGIAMDENFKKQMQEMQSLTVIEVSPNTWSDPKAPKLDDKALKSMEAIPGVQKVVPSRSINAYLKFGKYRTSSQIEIRGLSAEEMEILGYKVGEGKLFDKTDTKAIVLGREITRQFVKPGQQINWNKPPDAKEFELGEDQVKIDLGQYSYDTNEPVSDQDGNQIEVPRQERVTVLGLFKEEDWENSYIALVPLNLFEKLKEEQEKYNKKVNNGQEENNKDKNKYQNVRVKVADESQVETVQQAIKDAGFRAYSPMEYLNEMKKVSSSIQIMLGGIGGISLLVAAIGITNTMMMSIYERTKEIGVMKVIGAKLTDIKKLFLVEALLIGALGGGVGVTVSYITSFLINKFGAQVAGGMMSMMGSEGGGAISIIPPWLALAALTFSTVIGLVAGYFPAKRAMSLSALTAIRTE